MKKYAIVLVAALLLSCSACANNADSPVLPAPTTSASTQQDLPAVSPDETMTKTAQLLGITSENYPRIDGSTSTLGIVQAIWDAMYQFGTDAYREGYPQTASKTVPSYHLLIDGEVDMIVVPYASADVLQAAKDAGVELEFHKIAAEALIFITPKENTAGNITKDEVCSIYLDYGITNWSELGGPDRELVPICRNADSGSQSQMDNLVLENQPMHPDILKNYVELTMDGLLEQTAHYHNGGLYGELTNSYALGYTLYTYLENMTSVTGIGDYLKMLSYEGVAPTVESIGDGSYPLSDGYYAVVRKDLPEDHCTRKIVAWLEGREGQAAIDRFGFFACLD